MGLIFREFKQKRPKAGAAGSSAPPRRPRRKSRRASPRRPRRKSRCVDPCKAPGQERGCLLRRCADAIMLLRTTFRKRTKGEPMKKIMIALALALAMGIGLCACGSSDSGSQEEETTAPAEETAMDETTLRGCVEFCRQLLRRTGGALPFQDRRQGIRAALYDQRIHRKRMVHS